MWTAEERLEHYCRIGLLGVAILHWIVFALMVSSSEAPISNQVPEPLGNLAAVLAEALRLI